MRNNSLVHVCLLLILVLSLVSGPKIIEVEGAGGAFGGGSGTPSDPYIIEDVDDLQKMASDLDAHYALKKDINAVVTKTWNAGAGFVPVGSYPNHFNGTLDGRNFTISSLYINRPSTSLVGLFGYVREPFIVKNLRLVDIEIIGTQSVGGIVGHIVYGDVVNCHTSGKVVGTENVGGITGYTQDQVLDSHSMVNVKGTYKVGGIVGHNQGSIQRCSSTGNVEGTGSVGGLIGYNIGRVSNSHYNIDAVLINGGNYLTAGGLYDDQYQDWKGSGMVLDISDYGSTLVKNGDHYDIGDVMGVRDLLLFSDVRDLKFRLSTDIDLASAPGLYIPYYEGSEFDGANHTISNLLIDQDFASNIGLFGRIYWNIDVKNVKVTDVEVRGYAGVGGLIGYQVGGSLSNCFVFGDVYGSSMVGGLIASGTYLSIKNCKATGSITGTGSYSSYIGGLIGYLNGHTISDCHAECDVTGTGNQVGGLIGSMFYGKVSNCSATGSVSDANDYVGGLIGDNRGEVSGCFATGPVSGVGWGVGGLIGYNDRGEIHDCYATGKVTGIENAIGGLAGQNDGRITNCYSIGNVSGSGIYFGGLVGSNDFSVSNSFWDMETSGRSYSDGGTGKTTSEMKTKGTFTDAGWDFNVTWHLLGGVTYPFLRWQDAGSPIADAGADQITYLGPEGEVNVLFDGTGSEDDLAIINYTWNFEHDGSEVVLFGQEVEYIFSVHGIYDVTLNVTDISGNWDTDPTIVAVFDITSPIANAGPDQTVDEGTLVTFDGSASSDNAGIVEYEWTFRDDGPVSLMGMGPNYRFDDPGTFIVTLKVTDAADNSNLDTLTVTVNDITPPIADAGPDQTVDEGTLVTFDGNGSYDNIGIVNWTWSFTDDRPIMVHGVNPTHLFERPGTFLVILNITDLAGHWDLDNMTVTVNDITLPSADAGPDQTVDEGTIVTFNGNGSTDNVGIVNWTWSFTDGLPVMIYGSNTTYLFDSPGTFVVTLNVSDAADNWHADTMTVTVLDTSEPLANAGENRTVPAGTMVTLNGSLSSDNVGIKKFSWSFSYDGVERTLDGEVVSFEFDKGGSYEIVLTVTDRSDNTDEDAVTITVIETGKVTGIVLDKDGNPVPGSTVEITASNGFKYTTTTGPDGSFSVDVFYGSFAWKITKSGYKTVSGTGTVGPMGEMEIDLSGTPFVKEKKDKAGFSPSICVYLIMAAVIIFLLGLIIFLLVRRKGSQDIDGWEEE